MTEHTIGIDISKTHLDAFRLEDQTARQFENAPRGFRALIHWLGQTPVARIVFEPTGPYHRAFETALSKHTKPCNSKRMKPHLQHIKSMH